MKAETVSFSKHENQYIATIVANLVFMSYGSMIGWISPATPILMSNESPLKTGPLNQQQLSWCASINAFAAILGTITFGLITMLLGCKNTIHTLALSPILFYTLIYYGDSYDDILIARFFMGFGGGGIQTIIVLYVAEIANNDIRGSLGSISHISRNTGILLAYILGALVPYKAIPCIFIYIPIIFIVWFGVLPNTPNYYLKRGNLQKAENALRFYKKSKVSSNCEDVQLKAEFDHLKFLVNNRKTEEKFCLKDIFNRPALMGILYGSVLSALAFMTGFLVFATYAVVIFKEAGAKNINPHISAISMAVLHLIGNLCTAALSDTLGRKALLITSLLGSACGIFTFAFYCYLRSIGFDVTAFEFVPVISLLFAVFSASTGVVPLMFLSIIEHIPSEIQTIGVTICVCVSNTVSFVILKIFPILMALIGLHATMLIFAVSCTFGSIFVFFVINETKGISLEFK